MSKQQVIMSEEMVEVLEKAQKEFSISKEIAFKRAFALLKIYTEEKSKNNNIIICDKSGNHIKSIE